MTDSDNGAAETMPAETMPAETMPAETMSAETMWPTFRGGFELVAVGASLGGLTALQTLLGGLPAAFPPALAIVQHRSADSGSALAHLLERGTSRPVIEVDDREPILPGRVYLAPPAYHLLVERRGRFSLSTEGAVSWARPSIDVLFETAADAYGQQAIGVLLTGSNEDGAAGLAAIGRRGGLVVVQDPAEAESPVAPAAALARWPQARVMRIAEMPPFLAGVAGVGTRRDSPARSRPRAASPQLSGRET